VMGGDADNAFALVRPPGHHARPDRAMGFCLLNSAAIAAEAARRAGAERVLILDWDVHHGNGTQEIFEARQDVLYMSVHQYPFYPGTGAAAEVGVGAGRGATVNCALPGGQADADYGVVFHDLFLPVGRAFAPDLIIVSAGFDAHARDPLAEMRVTERGFAAMGSALRELAADSCGGKLVLLLEGGYDLGALASSVHASLEALTGRHEDFPKGAGTAAIDAVLTTRAALRSAGRIFSPT
jgi:acetoin utilization deacetylase AcuC-like enzyme